MRFTLASLIGLVVLVAVSIGALPLIAQLFQSLVLGPLALVLYATLFYAVFASGISRAYWLGFNAASWAYIVWSLHSVYFWKVLVLLEGIGLLRRGSMVSAHVSLALVALVPTLLLGHLGGSLTRWFFVTRKCADNISGARP